MEKKQKRYYKVGEMVWIVAEKKEGKVKVIDTKSRKVTVLVDNEELSLDLWAIDKLKYKAKADLVKSKSTTKANNNDLKEIMEMLHKLFRPEVYYSKVRESAIVPSKRKEDAGYDIYANLDNFKRETDEGVVYEIECPVLATTLVPTGLALALPDTHYFNLKHERGSTGVQSMSVLAGVIDSGFRNEMFIAMTPLRKSVIITSAVSKVEENDTHILYPLSKAICQGTVDIVPDTQLSELPYEELKNIASERGMTMLGESGK